jgi:ABC-type ATPase with predicted acetyltransferase domain
MLESDGDGALSVEDARTWAEERQIPFLEGAEVIAALHG